MIEPLEYLAKEGIRINFNKDNILTILVGKGRVNENYVYIGPGEESGTIGVCYVPKKTKKSHLLNINSSGHGLTQIAFTDKLYTVCHTKKNLLRYYNDSFIEISRNEYDKRIGQELGFWF